MERRKLKPEMSGEDVKAREASVEKNNTYAVSRFSGEGGPALDMLHIEASNAEEAVRIGSEIMAQTSCCAFATTEIIKQHGATTWRINFHNNPACSKDNSMEVLISVDKLSTDASIFLSKPRQTISMCSECQFEGQL